MVKNLLARFVREDHGQDIIEYALLAAFVSIIAAAIIQTIGGDITTIFNAVKAQTGAAAS
jgi:Flp pilus assembly pilin Flp